MKDEDFDGIVAGLTDAIAFVKGDETRGRVVAGPDIKAIRKRAGGVTQAKFAETYHLPIGTIRDWEQGRSSPDAPARVLLGLIECDPELVAKMLVKA